MASPKQNYLLNFLMGILFLLLAITGLILFFSPKGGNELLGIQKHTLTTIHNYTGIIFIIIVLLHLILHFSWIKAMTKAIFKKDKKEKISP